MSTVLLHAFPALGFLFLAGATRSAARGATTRLVYRMYRASFWLFVFTAVVHTYLLVHALFESAP